MDDHLCYLRATPPKESFIPKFTFFYFVCSQDEKVECEEGYQPLRKENCKDCQSQQVYVNLAPNVNTVKPHGAVKPLIVQTLSWLIPSVPIALISPWSQNLYVESAVPTAYIVTIPVCGTTKTKVLVQANAGFEKSLSKVRIPPKNLENGYLRTSTNILKSSPIT